MDINILKVDARVPVTIFQLDGMLNMGSSGALQQKAVEQRQAGMRYMLLDLSKLTSLSSAGLRVIQFVYKLLQEGDDSTSPRKSGEKSPYLKLLNPMPDIQRVLSIAGFDTFIDVFFDRDEALRSF
jgi:anti-anti-sigma factor